MSAKEPDDRRPRNIDWANAEEVRREAMQATTPAERLELLEEIVDIAFSAQELNPRLRPKERKG